MDIQSVKKVYQDHYGDKGYDILPSSPLVHSLLPTTFVMSVGLLQLEPILNGGTESSGWDDFAMVQRCFRHHDMELVGQGNRLSFFEMAGAITSGDKTPEEVIRIFLELMFQKYGFQPDQLIFTVFGGGSFHGQELPPDEDSYRALLAEGIESSYIIQLGVDENLFGTASREKYCGPSVETFLDRGQDPSVPPHPCIPGCFCGRFIEIANTVFLRYRKTDNALVPLPQVYGESALGVERTALALSGMDAIYDLPEIAGVRDAIEDASKSGKTSLPMGTLNTAADHLRGICFAIADGAQPGHGGRRYVLRKLIRRFLVRVRSAGSDFEKRLQHVVESLATANRHVISLSAEVISEIVNTILVEKSVFDEGLADYEKYMAGPSARMEPGGGS